MIPFKRKEIMWKNDILIIWQEKVHVKDHTKVLRALCVMHPDFRILYEPVNLLNNLRNREADGHQSPELTFVRGRAGSGWPDRGRVVLLG
ncbi:hypothetical protein CTEST_10355 [Corynebacterium testudinoris]|uniref:Uncharacterized protein n=1 Tax=Corynebacterium testudinoris TaxID=136857 RepID=A0A0G3H818_9CORY|nr:hypothetical protein CTEST_10355 [Corynebacterium testudinoris]